MTETDVLKLFFNALPQVGIGLIFLYLYLKERKRNEVLTERIIDLYKESIGMLKDVKNILESVLEHVKNTARLIDALAKKVNSFK